MDIYESLGLWLLWQVREVAAAKGLPRQDYNNYWDKMKRRAEKRLLRLLYRKKNTVLTADSNNNKPKTSTSFCV